jgi:Vanin C-terminal domain
MVTGVQTQAMWAHALDVNFLAAGFNHPRSGKGGSGIFRGNTGRVVDATPWDISSFYLIGSLPVEDPKRRFGASEPIRAVGPVFAKNRPQLTSDATTPFYIQENLTNYQSALVELKREIMHYHLCSDDLCCDLEVSGELQDQTVFRFFVFSGEREFGRGLYKGYKIQTCALARCKFAEDPVANCALVMNGVAQNVELTHVRISGNFNNDAMIGPNIVDGKFEILSGNKYIFRREPAVGNVSKVDFQLAERIEQNILTFGVWGRVFKPIESGVTDHIRAPSWILPTSFAIGAVFIVVCLLVTVVKFTPNKYKLAPVFVIF